ncbi:MAG: ATP synthase subunit I [Thermaerobacterales bacterium]
MEWSAEILAWRVAGWFLLGLAVSWVNHRLVAGALSRAKQDPQRGPVLIMSRYLVRMATNFGMIFAAFFLDGHTYVLLAALAGLLSLTVFMAVIKVVVKEET